MNNQKIGIVSQPGLVVKNSYHSSKGPPLIFFIMKLNIKVALLCIIVLVLLITMILWNRCGYVLKDWGDKNSHIYIDEFDTRKSATELDCRINGDSKIGCLKEGDEVYLPFSFLREYFEIYGTFSKHDSKLQFEWSHSYSKIYRPKGKYDSKGVFMHFENYNVENRDRVKCVSGIDGVPISTQWESRGYYYPTQIAQFGLSHYSKNLTEPEPRRKVIEDADENVAEWTVPDGSILRRVYDDDYYTSILKFTTSNIYSEGINLKMEHVLDFVISMNIFLYANSSFTVTLQNREKKNYYNLHYVSSDISITSQDNNIYHGIGINNTWKKLTRDLIIDVQKGLSYLEKDKSKYKVSRSKLKIVNVILRGDGYIDNVTLSSSEHISQFYDAAEWFVKNQNQSSGGWPIPVKRRVAAGFQDLTPIWYSAMSQGHAISVLARAYHHSGHEPRYLNAALAGLKLFRVASSKGGILATFYDKYFWYEEYPTQPSSFVLNGFIYSLLGLYDLTTIAPFAKEAEQLFHNGIESLKNMLPLFDMGSVTCYDLRHITIGTAPNLARWDYHATHVNQLLLLNTICDELMFAQTAERWIGYMSGKRAAHN